jgi:hypothetical protein
MIKKQQNKAAAFKSKIHHLALLKNMNLLFLDKLKYFAQGNFYFTFPGDANSVCGSLIKKPLVGKHAKSHCLKPGFQIKDDPAPVIQHDLETITI